MCEGQWKPRVFECSVDMIQLCTDIDKKIKMWVVILTDSKLQAAICF